MLEHIFTTLGVSKSSFFGGLIGALVSFQFMPDGLTRTGRGSSFLCAIATTWYVPPIIVESVPLKESLIGPIAFVVGVFGMALIGSVMKAIPSFIESVRKRIDGSGGGA